MADYLAVIFVGTGSCWGRDADKENAIRRAMRKFTSSWIAGTKGGEATVNVVDVAGYDDIEWDSRGAPRRWQEPRPGSRAPQASLRTKAEGIMNTRHRQMIDEAQHGTALLWRHTQATRSASGALRVLETILHTCSDTLSQMRKVEVAVQHDYIELKLKEIEGSRK